MLLVFCTKAKVWGGKEWALALLPGLSWQNLALRLPVLIDSCLSEEVGRLRWRLNLKNY
jgi:hypothetical protein